MSSNCVRPRSASRSSPHALAEPVHPFGLGEMTLTRCVVQVDDAIGVGYVSGRSPEHARRVALTDALLQGRLADRVHAEVIEPLRADRAARSSRQTAEAEATRVQFLTMVRGN